MCLNTHNDTPGSWSLASTHLLRRRRERTGPPTARIIRQKVAIDGDMSLGRIVVHWTGCVRHRSMEERESHGIGAHLPC